MCSSDLTIPTNDKDYELKTVGDIVRGVEKLIAQKGGGAATGAGTAA